MFRKIPRTFDSFNWQSKFMRSLEGIHKCCTISPLETRVCRKCSILVHKIINLTKFEIDENLWSLKCDFLCFWRVHISNQNFGIIYNRPYSLLWMRAKSSIWKHFSKAQFPLCTLGWSKAVDGRSFIHGFGCFQT